MKRLTENIDYDYVKLKNLINSICERYPFVGKKVIGKSCGGRDIVSLTLGKGEEYVLFAAAFHGSEHITTNILMMFFEDLCLAVSKGLSLAGIDMQKGLFGRGIIVIPCVNPDGAEISIRGKAGAGERAEFISKISKEDYTHYNANLRGVDINHNFNADWESLRKSEIKSGIFGPAPTRFGGERPESEPETAALCDLCRTKRMRHVLALHSQGEVIYWTFGDKKPPKSERMAQIMATSSGYALDVPLGLAVGGGFKDWFISEFNRPGFTVEVGSGRNPLPIENSLNIYKGICEMLSLSAIM